MFLYESGEYKDINSLIRHPTASVKGINDLGQMMGTFEDPTGKKRLFLYENEEFKDLGSLEENRSIAPNDINNSGQIVGSSEADFPNRKAFLCDDGEMKDIGNPKDYYGGSVTGINDRKQILFHAYLNVPGFLPPSSFFLWEDGEFINLEEEFFANSNWENFYYRSNNLRQIVGTGSINGQSHGFLITPSIIPEPSTIFMFLWGLFGCYWIKKKNKTLNQTDR